MGEADGANAAAQEINKVSMRVRVCHIAYVRDHEDALRRLRLGQRQELRVKCGRWHWRNEKCSHTTRGKR